MTLSQNRESLQKLRSALCFYRENRELIQTIAGSMGAARPNASQGDPAREQPSKSETKESQPDSADSLKVFEEYLKRCAV